MNKKRYERYNTYTDYNISYCKKLSVVLFFFSKFELSFLIIIQMKIANIVFVIFIKIGFVYKYSCDYLFN